jgi:hypothetical protein
MAADTDHSPAFKRLNLLQLANGVEIIKTMILIQGGAFAAFAAFLAATLASGNHDSLVAASAIMPALKYFGVGAAWSLFALLTEILAREFYDMGFEKSRSDPDRWYRSFLILGLVARLLSASILVYCLLQLIRGLRASGEAFETISTTLQQAVATLP